jgi:hypothetical protein
MAQRGAQVEVLDRLTATVGASYVAKAKPVHRLEHAVRRVTGSDRPRKWGMCDETTGLPRNSRKDAKMKNAFTGCPDLLFFSFKFHA